MILTDGVSIDLTGRQYSVGHMLSGMSVVVTRGVAESFRKIENKRFIFYTY